MTAAEELEALAAAGYPQLAAVIEKLLAKKEEPA